MTWQRVRTTIIFGIGVVGMSSELVAWVLTARAPDPTLTVAFVGMMGLPWPLNKDEKGDQ